MQVMALKVMSITPKRRKFKLLRWVHLLDRFVVLDEFYMEVMPLKLTSIVMFYNPVPSTIRSRDSSVGIVSDYGLDDRRSGLDPRQGQSIFPLSSVSRPALGPTQPPVQ
jgi:hypothetical protein